MKSSVCKGVRMCLRVIEREKEKETERERERESERETNRERDRERERERERERQRERITVVISNPKEFSEILRDIRTLTYQICRTEETIIRTTTFNKYICNWSLEVRDILKILWKRGEIAP